MDWNEYYDFRRNVCNSCQKKCRQRIDIDKCIAEGIKMMPYLKTYFEEGNVYVSRLEDWMQVVREQ